MNDILSTLNENQRQAASTIDQHVRIIAGAGSGKTRVLMARIVHLIKDLGIWPNRILAITFTNKATNEMKERLQALLGDEAAGVRISTIHSLCVRILREDCEVLGYPKGFTILDGDDQRQILRPFYKQMDLDVKALPMTRVLGFISGFKTEGVSPQEAMANAQSQEFEQIATLYGHYEHIRKDMKAMDFDDLLLEGYRLLKTSTAVRNKWQNRLDYIHVDEFQDVDNVQYGIVRLLTGPDCKLCVVGDPDQTIYTWRGASVQIILRFDQDFQPCKTVILNENYRSIQPILDASNAVVKHNSDRIEKDLYTNIKGDEKIRLYEASDDQLEPLHIARQIVEAHKQGTAYEDMAILYRSNYSSRAFERTLRKVNIPYIIYGGIRFYERQEIKDALSYLRLCAPKDPDDPEQLSLDLAVLRVINQPRRGIGAKSIETLREQASKRGMNLYEVMKDPQDLSGAIVKKCQGFVELIEGLRANLDNYSLEDFLDYMLDETGYMMMLKEDHEEDRIENLNELKADIAQSLKEDPSMTLTTYLQDIALFTDKASQASGNAVNLMTVHAAKGLEFDTVFMVNFNEGVFPSARAMDESGRLGLEEERRLCYVAMTRAKRHLSISWNTGYSYMIDGYKTPSRFLKEIPKEFTDLPEEKPKEMPIAKQKAAMANVKRPGRYHKGELVEHVVYGQGVVINQQAQVVTVAFGHSVGVKKLNANHPSLKKAE